MRKAEVIYARALSHAWSGTGGTLSVKDALDTRDSNSWANWRKVKPMVHKLFEAIVAAPAHCICTLRAHTEWEAEQNDRGKVRPVKVGLKPITMPDTDYEFDVIGNLDLANTLTVEARGCPDFHGAVIPKPTYESFEPYIRWLSEGDAIESKEKFEEVVASAHSVRQQVKRSKALAPVSVQAPEISNGIIEEIKTLVRQLGWKPSESREKVLAPVKVKRLAELPPQRLKALKAKLETEVTANEAKVVF